MLEVSAETIREIVHAVFEATFAIAVEDAAADDSVGASIASSLVGIAGRWDGAVIVDCATAVAHELASTMFGVPADEVGRDQVEDALGELANMIGGNLKALLPSPCALSLPTVVEGRDYRVRVPGATIVRDVHFTLPGGGLRVLVAERGGVREAA